MNRKQLEERKAALLAAVKELQNNLIATDGAIQECDYWLAVLDAEEAVQKNQTPTEQSVGEKDNA